MFGTVDETNEKAKDSFEFAADFDFKTEPANNTNNNNSNSFEFPSNLDFNAFDTKTENTQLAVESKPKKEINENNITFERFYELTHDPCWNYNGPTPSELFAQKDQFANADEAFQFLMKEH